MKLFHLEPRLIAFPNALQKGALVLLPSPAESTKTTGSAGSTAPGGAAKAGPILLRFQYNPETVTRTRSGAWEPRKTGQDPSAGGSAQNRAAAAFRGGGLYAKSETVAMKLVFDASEMLADPDATSRTAADGSKPRDLTLGILPELGVLERMGIAEAPGKDDAKKSAKDTKLTSVIPKHLLLVLGKRVFPVIITNMTITEKRFDPSLVPVRAEVDLQMQVMESTEVTGQPPLEHAYAKLLADREAWATIAGEPVALDASSESSFGSAVSVINDSIRQGMTGGGPGGKP